MKKLESEEENESIFDKEQFDQHMTRKLFFIPSFEIYGGVAGLYDFGPVGCGLKNNILSKWKEHFILNENMLEMDCSNLTPYKVLQVSGKKRSKIPGHVDRFTDFMVKDVKTGECYRADVRYLLKTEISRRLYEKCAEGRKR